MINRFKTFTVAISEIWQHWNKIAADEMKHYQMKGAYAVYLVILHSNPDGVTSTQLGEMSNRDKAEISRAVSDMEKSGMIKREIVHKNSYRALLKLTEKGSIAAEKVQKRAMLAVEEGGKGISDADRENFYHCLLTIAANLKNLSEEGLPE